MKTIGILTSTTDLENYSEGSYIWLQSDNQREIVKDVASIFGGIQNGYCRRHGGGKYSLP